MSSNVASVCYVQCLKGEEIEILCWLVTITSSVQGYTGYCYLAQVLKQTVILLSAASLQSLDTMRLFHY